MIIVKRAERFCRDLVSGSRVEFCLEKAEHKLRVFGHDYRQDYVGVVIVDNFSAKHWPMNYGEFVQVITLEAWIGNYSPDIIGYDYLENARHMAWTSFRRKCDNRIVLKPDDIFHAELSKDDSLWIGAIYRPDLVVATSGLDEDDDESFSKGIGADIQALINKARGEVILPAIKERRDRGQDTWGGHHFNLLQTK